MNIAADIGPDQNNADYSYHPSVVAIKNGNTHINTFAFRPVKPEEVFTKLQKLKLNKATGCDKMPAKKLKIVSLNIATPLASLINASIRQCQFPHDLKLTNVSPVFKKDNMDKVNYRPVSILPAISKIYEGLLAEQMTCHFQGIFDNYLSAFRKTYGCQSILLKLVEDWRHALDNKMIVGAILTDLSKAFDSLPHKLLIEKLKAYGLTIDARNLIENYLTSRKQRVKIGQVCSELSSISKGVPQGSILGPFLFNIFMNDIFYFVRECDLYGYADDNTLSKAANDAASLKRAHGRDTANTLSWFTENYMSANPDKFQAIVLGMTNPETINFAVGNVTINQIEWQSSGLSLLPISATVVSSGMHAVPKILKSSKNFSYERYVLSTTIMLVPMTNY